MTDKKGWLGPYAPTDRHADQTTLQELVRLRKVNEKYRWKPIDTAPKDGSVVLIFDPSREKWKINSAYWPNHWDKPCFLSAGQGVMLDKATHWMELPEEPQ